MTPIKMQNGLTKAVKLQEKDFIMRNLDINFGKQTEEK